ncbi:MAG: SMP-30/gluconolactonase/LRE family protein, partial [Planctomycetes bacterium]|nr:SMP-30/gluconolactonase/LRE family protein [Planctomycetota bacterium]
MFSNRIRSLGPLLIAWVVLFGVRSDRTFAGVYEDLGTPVIGAWKQGAWVFWDPRLKRDLLWSQECSQDGAILYCLDLETGQVLEEYDIPAREIGDIRSSSDGTLYIKGVSGLTQPGNELLRFNPYRRTIERLGLPGTPRNRIASFTVGWDGNIYVGTHREGRLFRFSPFDHTWKDLGQVVPAPVLPRQHIWLQNIQQLSDKTILASVVRAPAAQVVAVNPMTGSFREVKPTQSGGYQIYGKDLIESTGSGIRFYDVQFQVKSEISYFTFDGADLFDTDTRFSLASIDNKNRAILRVGREVIRADLHQKRLKRCAKLPFEGIVLFTSDDRA